MTKEKAEKILPVIQAIINGQKIQVNINNRWEDVDENHNCAFLPESYEYRIKPEPKYRPFANAEECWKEMQKHQPFGWVKTIHDEDPEVFIHCEVITKIDGVLTSIDEVPFSYDNMYRTYTFADGTPFGILEEEWLWHG